MKKIKGVIDRFEDNKAIIRYNGSEIILEKDLVLGKKESDSVIVVIMDEGEDLEKSNEVAQNLLTQVLKGE